MADIIKSIGDIPINVDNEGLIIANAMKSAVNREIFIKRVNWQEFRMKEYQSIAYGIITAAEDGVTVEPSMVSLKSRGCPIRFYLDADSIDNLLNKYKEVTANDFNVHLETLRLDNVRASIEMAMQDSLAKTLLDPASKLGDIEERIQYLNEIVQRGYSVSRSEFKSMNEVMDDFIVERETGVFHRTTGFRQLDELLTGGFKDKEISIICGRPSMGKCFNFNTQILMFDGTYKKVQEVCIGDLVMGPDSNSRTVLSVTAGTAMLYKIKQKKGEDYIVNDDHILSLKKVGYSVLTRTGAKKKGRRRVIGWEEGGEILNLSVKEALLKPTKFFRRYNGYRTSIEFKKQNVLLDPYFLGIWLAEGNNCDQMITNPDKEIRNFLKTYATCLNLEYKEIQQRGCYNCRIIRKSHLQSNYILDALKQYNLLNNKHIPVSYKVNSRESRLQLLAGLLDGDGYLESKSKGCYEIITNYEILAEDILFLARSLGFYTTCRKVKKGIKKLNFIGEYYRIFISGDTYLVPCRVKRKKAKKINRKNSMLNSRISIEKYKEDKYFGFELDGDGLFLLKDFTVTHNSSFALSLMKNLSNKKVVAPQFALEMPNMSITTKLLAFNSDIAIKKIAGDWLKLTATEQDIIHNEIMRLRQNQGIYLNDKPSQSLAEIREQIMLLQDKLKTTYMVIFIDLFGKIRDFQDSDNFASDYEKKLNVVQVMTRALGVHMALVAQIRRSTTRKNQRPKMSEIKNAGAWEEVADNIFGLHRENYDPDVAFQQQIAYGEEHMDMSFNPEDNIAELLLLKGRMSGNNKILYMFFNPITTRFGMFDSAYQQELRERMRFNEPE